MTTQSRRFLRRAQFLKAISDGLTSPLVGQVDEPIGHQMLAKRSNIN